MATATKRERDLNKHIFEESGILYGNPKLCFICEEKEEHFIHKKERKNDSKAREYLVLRS